MSFTQTSLCPQARVLAHTLITLVQTDKAKYKAGQKVLFRVVTLKSDLSAEEETVSAGEGTVTALGRGKRSTRH